ncbi:hypothetical protein KC660_04135 [Candidatus Dojkabacteria bacterium]|uniref:Uncharacterized protein n=1 Tax=Candidatus Dojkabacteria bacterium TaxID=2099670 RepID=A0A955L491_9BACT|nr:hypothetical protein [Candidatus Dojkabacteria bacterium]
MPKKQSRLRKSVAIIFLVFSIVLASAGLLLGTFVAKFYSPTTYTEALSDSGFYTQVTGILEDYSINIVKEAGKDLVKNVNENSNQSELVNAGVNAALNYLIENKSEIFVASIFNTLKVEQKIENSINGSIDGVLSWLTGQSDDPPIFAIIPNEDEINNLNDQGLFTTISNVIGINTIQLTNLPECSTDQEETDNLNKLQDGNLLQLTCTSDKIRSVAKDKISSLIPENVKEEANSSIDQIIEKYNIEPIKAKIYAVLTNLNQFKQSAYDLQSYVLWTISIPITLIIISILLGIVGIIISEKGKRFKNFLILIFATGVIVYFNALVYALYLGNKIYEKINLGNISITNEVISPAREALFIQSIEIALKDIIHSFYQPAMSVGLSLILISVIIYAVSEIIKRRKSIKKFASKQYRKVVK